MPRTRHIEVQVFGDRQGNIVHFGERECSLQRHYQKIIEEAPCVRVSTSPHTQFYLSNEERQQLYGWATALAKASGYEGAGTVEFLCDASNASNASNVSNASNASNASGAPKAFYFMEMNTRLQVEHLVSQRVNGDRDFVELQIRVGHGAGVQRRSRRASRCARWA